MLGANFKFMPLLTVQDNTVEAVAYVAHTMALSGVTTVLLDPEGRAPVDGRTAAKQADDPTPLLRPGNGNDAKTAREAVTRWSENNEGATPQIAAVVQPHDDFVFLTGPGLEQWWVDNSGWQCPPRTFGRYLAVEGVTANRARGDSRIQVAGIGSIVPLPPSGDVYMTAGAITAPPGLGAVLDTLPYL